MIIPLTLVNNVYVNFPKINSIKDNNNYFYTFN